MICKVCGMEYKGVHYHDDTTRCRVCGEVSAFRVCNRCRELEQKAVDELYPGWNKDVDGGTESGAGDRK